MESDSEIIIKKKDDFVLKEKKDHLAKLLSNKSTAAAMNSTLLVLSELRKRDPPGFSLDSATLKARLKAVVQVVVKSTTCDQEKTLLQELSALFNSPSALTSALLSFSSLNNPAKALNLDEIIDTTRLSDLINNEDVPTVPDLRSRKSLLKFRKSQKLKSTKTCKKVLKKASRKLKKMDGTLACFLETSPLMQPISGSFLQNNGLNSLEIPLLPPLELNGFPSLFR